MTDSIKRHVTVRDIAKVTGLHHTTVSLGLRNSPKLLPATLQAIQKAAKDLGYVPDPMISALNAYRTSKRQPHYQATIAWVNNWPDREQLLEVSTFRQYYEGVLDRAQRLGYLIEEFWLQKPGMTPERMMRILKARNIQGLLMFPQPNPHTLFPLDYRDFSVVVFGYSVQPPILNVVTNHQYHSMNLLLSELIQLGYRRIGVYLWSDWDEKVENAWLGGLKLAYWTNPQLVPIPPCQDQPGGKSLVSWLRKYKPDVVVSYDQVLQNLKDLGFAIPRDLGFASLDKREPRDPIISGLNENSFYIGQKAVDVLVGLLQRGERGIPPIPIRLLVESTWVPGQTLRRQDGELASPPHKL